MIITRLIGLPISVKGATVKDEDDNFNIYINKDLSAGEQIDAYLHEIQHINLGHFYDNKSVSTKESEIK